MKQLSAPPGVVPRRNWLNPRLFKSVQASVPIVCVDLAVLRKVRKNKKWSFEVLLIKRKIYPEAGTWCFVGGRILKDETTSAAIARQARRELGVTVAIMPPWAEHLPLRVDNVRRADKQKHYISLLFPVHIHSGTLRGTGPEFSEWRWFPVAKLPRRMGFIHGRQAQEVAKALKNL